MNVDEKIAELCRTYSVKPSFGARLRSLVQRALASPREKRERLLQLVERSFAEESRRSRGAERLELLSKGELKLLYTVADLLHPWTPPKWMAGLDSDAPEDDEAG